MDYAKQSLKLHRQWKGKIQVAATVPVRNKEDLSLAYTPGVDVYKRQMQHTAQEKRPLRRSGLSLSKNPCGSGATAFGGLNRIWRPARQIRKKPCAARVSLHDSLAAL